MKIWLITSEYPGEGTTGGIAKYVESMAQALAGRGMDLTVIARSKRNDYRQIAERISIVEFTSNDDKLASENPEGSPIRAAVFPYQMMTNWLALSYQMADVVEELIQRIGAPDVIECQEHGALPYYLLQRKLVGNPILQKIPILVHCHGPFFLVAGVNHQPALTFPDYWMGEMEKFSMAAADALLCPSHYVAKQIAELVPCRGEIQVIPYLIPSLASLTSSSVSSPSLEKPRVLYFGRMEIHKGVLQALKSIESLWNSGRDFRVILIGEDAEYKARGATVGAFIRSRYAHRIQTGLLEIHGSYPWNELQKHINSAQVVIVPSLWDNFPSICMEAMSLGRVVLASKSGGQAEMIGEDGQAGVLFDWEVLENFTTQLDRLLKIGAEEREQIGERARQRIAEYCSVEKIVSQRLRHFEEVVERHQKPTLFPAAWRSYTPPTAIHNESFRQGCKQPLRLSVIIPFFNLGKYVGDAVLSVLASTCLPEEILIINDGSTEQESLVILQELEDRHPLVRVIDQTNQGLAAARNRGAEEARGKYIAFLDADDDVRPEFFAKALWVLDAYANVGFVYSWVQNFENSQTMWSTWNVHLPYLLGSNMLVANCVVRREAFLEVGGNNPKIEYSMEDYECWINLTKHGWLGVSLPECLVRYRIRTGSMLRSATEEQFRYMYDLIVRLHPELYQQWGHELTRLQATNGSVFRWNNPADRYFQPIEGHLRSLERQRDELWLQVQILQKLQPFTKFFWKYAKTSASLVRSVSNIGSVRFVLRRPFVRKALGKMEKVFWGAK